MAFTQLASMFIGTPDITVDDMDKLRGITSTTGNIIHITDGKTDEILDIITAKNVKNNEHFKSIKTGEETFDAELIGEQSYDEHLVKGNRVVIPSEYDGEYIEFVIDRVIDSRGDSKNLEIYTYASFIEISKSKAIKPFSYLGTAEQHLARALTGTEHSVGSVESAREITISFSNYTEPYEYIKRIANEFDLEPNFRVLHNGLMVTGRPVDLIDKIGAFRGREFTFGKDLEEITRTEDGDIYTALIGLGPEDDQGNRHEVLVEDLDSLNIWGRPDKNGELQHLIGVYEPESSDDNMSVSKLRQYTQTELNKRKSAVIDYEMMALDLEHVKGHEEKVTRFGDVIRAKDTVFTPALYVEARIFEMKRNVVTPMQKKYTFGDFVEFDIDDIHALYNAIEAAKRRAMNLSQVEAKAVEKYLNSLRSEKGDMDSKYGEIYGSSYLSGKPKTNLLNAKINYNGAHGKLLISIDNAIFGGKTTPAQKDDVDAKYTTYRTLLATLTKRLEQANDSITKKKADDAEDNSVEYTDDKIDSMLQRGTFQMIDVEAYPESPKHTLLRHDWLAMRNMKEFIGVDTWEDLSEVQVSSGGGITMSGPGIADSLSDPRIEPLGDLGVSGLISDKSKNGLLGLANGDAKKEYFGVSFDKISGAGVLHLTPPNKSIPTIETVYDKDYDTSEIMFRGEKADGYGTTEYDGRDSTLSASYNNVDVNGYTMLSKSSDDGQLVLTVERIKEGEPAFMSRQNEDSKAERKTWLKITSEIQEGIYDGTGIPKASTIIRTPFKQGRIERSVIKEESIRAQVLGYNHTSLSLVSSDVKIYFYVDFFDSYDTSQPRGFMNIRSYVIGKIPPSIDTIIKGSFSILLDVTDYKNVPFVDKFKWEWVDKYTL